MPVGEDQAQHLQMAQQLVKTFNNRMGVTFPSPRALIQGDSYKLNTKSRCPWENNWFFSDQRLLTLSDSYSSRLRSLRVPTKKMSKSEPDPRSRINLLDSPDEISEKLKKAVTDCRSE